MGQDFFSDVSGPIPFRPLMKPSQVSATVIPSGVTAPRPVTTTRRHPVRGAAQRPEASRDRGCDEEGRDARCERRPLQQADARHEHGRVLLGVEDHGRRPVGPGKSARVANRHPPGLQIDAPAPVTRRLEVGRRCAGETRLFITPGFSFRIVDRMVTNFHLPESTLMMLVCAFGGYERVMRAYRHAVVQRYRFFSYGDAMLLER